MTSHKPEAKHDALHRIVRGASILLIAALIGSGAGCKEKKKPAPPPPPPPKPVAVIPDPVDVGGLLQTMKSDARVQFPQDRSPADRSLAESVIRLSNALARGDAAGMRGLLDKSAQSVLDELISSGGWAEETKSIEQVRVVALSGTQDARADASLVGLAIQGQNGAYLLAWNAKRDGDNWIFAAAPCQADVKPRASDFDGVGISSDISVASSAPTSDVKETSARATPKGPDPVPAAQPEGPKKKSTPAGPINIPGGGS